MGPMSIFIPRCWRRFTSATEWLNWTPVDPDGYDEPKAVFDPQVWRQLLDADDRVRAERASRRRAQAAVS